MYLTYLSCLPVLLRYYKYVPIFTKIHNFIIYAFSSKFPKYTCNRLFIDHTNNDSENLSGS